MEKGHLVAFSLYWCLAFAYQVGILITAHTTGQNFPWFNVLQVVSAVGAADAYFATHGKDFAFQVTEGKALGAVYIALAVSFAAYAFFIWDVVGEVSLLCSRRKIVWVEVSAQICDYFDINCLTVSPR